MCWWCGTCRPNGEIREGDFGGEGKLLIEYRRDWKRLPVAAFLTGNDTLVRWNDLVPPDDWTAHLFQPEPLPADFLYE